MTSDIVATYCKAMPGSAIRVVFAARLKQRMSAPPADLQHLLSRLAKVPAKGYLNQHRFRQM